MTICVLAAKMSGTTKCGSKVVSGEYVMPHLAPTKFVLSRARKSGRMPGDFGATLCPLCCAQIKTEPTEPTEPTPQSLFGADVVKPSSPALRWKYKREGEPKPGDPE